LRNGDTILTSDKHIVQINVFSFTLDKTTTLTAPYRIQANTFGTHDELCLTGGHAIKDTQGLWQMPKRLIRTNPGVTQYDIGKPITYYHIECPNYFTDNLIAEGLVVESFKNKQDSTHDAYRWDEIRKGYIRKQHSSFMTPNNNLVSVGDIGQIPIIIGVKKKKKSHSSFSLQF
jgi:hypothetical protein